MPVVNEQAMPEKVTADEHDDALRFELDAESLWYLEFELESDRAEEDREAIGRAFNAVLQRLSEPNATGEGVRDAAVAVCADLLQAARSADHNTLAGGSRAEASVSASGRQSGASISFSAYDTTLR